MTVDEGAEIRSAGIDARSSSSPTSSLMVSPSPKRTASRSRRTRSRARSASRRPRTGGAPKGQYRHESLGGRAGRGGGAQDPERPADRRLHHLASADPDEETTHRQLDAFDAVLAAHPFGGALVHAANSARHSLVPSSHYDCVRPGVALYGLHPKGDEGDPTDENLRPALSSRATWRMSGTSRLARGSPRADLQSRRADVRGYGAGRVCGVSSHPLEQSGGPHPWGAAPASGRVTMDTLRLGVDEGVEVGDEVVLLGEQGGESIRAEEFARWADTINLRGDDRNQYPARGEELQEE